MIPQTVDCDNDVTVTVGGVLRHACPFVDEQDIGTITVVWATGGKTFELHAFRQYLDTFNNSRVSHESITDRIQHDLSVVPGLILVSVTTTWNTAGFQVLVESGSSGSLLRQSFDSEGM